MTDAAQIEAVLRSELRSMVVARDTLPMLTTWGVEDFSHTIHSLGCNYLTAIGRASGFWAMSEYPIRVPKQGNGHSIRPDVAWWERSSREVALLGEFERAEPRNSAKLVEKARNLLHAHHALGERPRVLVLLAWAITGTNLGDLTAVRSVMASGFRTESGFPVLGLGPRSRFVLATAVFGDHDGRTRLIEVHQ
jgi:hypothetical protein